jgi:hypothetical protein
MPDAVKGGLFVGAAVATGILVGLFVPSLVGAGRDSGNRTRAQNPVPTMPGVVGARLDEADRELGRRGIAYETDAPQIVEVVAPSLLEVCESRPAPGRGIRGSAHLHVAVVGTCNI